MSRLGDEGDDGDEKPREPRLPLEDPPPARAQASAVHSTGTSTITSNAVRAVSLFIKFLLPEHIVYPVTGRATRV
jgi:hypothetical protein